MATDGIARGAAPRTERDVLLAAAAAQLRRRLQGEAGEQAAAFLAVWADGIADDDLAAHSAEDIAGSALSLFEHARTRAPGQANVRVLNPRPEAEGWRSPHSIAEIVTDDMPFLVDSALAACARLDRPVHLVIHPIVPVRRDAAGAIVAFGAAAGADAPRESMIQVEIAQIAGATELAAMTSALKRAMADVRIAVADWPAMRARLADAAGLLAGAGDADAKVARDFLTWMGEDNFVLLGYRRLDIRADGTPEAATDANLGLLRDAAVPVFDVLREPSAIPESLRSYIREAAPLSVAKANMRATVHRPQHCDVAILKQSRADGTVEAVHLFLGLFAADAYNRNPRSIPYLREKVAAVLALAGVDPKTHDGRRLSNILETYPRDELFQATVPELLSAARGMLALQERQRVALFVRTDRFERFISAIVFVPRDRMDTRLRQAIGDLVAAAYAGRLSTNYVQIGDGPLARVHYIIATMPGAVPEVDLRALERALAEAARSFRDRLAEALVAEHGEAAGLAVVGAWADAFPPGYTQARTASEAMADIALAEQALATGRLALVLSRRTGQAPHALTLRVAHPDGPVPLSDILPLIECLAFRAIEEVPHHLHPAGTGMRTVVLHEFVIETMDASAPDAAAIPLAAEALDALWAGRAEPDQFNRLVLRAGVSWRDAWVLRALYRWLKQVGFGFSQAAVEDALAAEPEATRTLVETFRARFDPDAKRDADAEAMLAEAWARHLDAIADPDRDRILTRMKQAMDAVLRTTAFTDPAAPVIAFKLDPRRAGDVPKPVPFAEIWVHGPRAEAVHLRAGAVARGGIRWSDRREDFRTEVLGLMKAQTLKNAVIVPTGAKGGFILKRPPAMTGDATKDREALLAEGIACYRLLIGAMLDLTDNRGTSGIIPPARVVRRDGDDPYIVAAADKGTATFSDIANGIATARGFWLGDAFASGGSKGYDHKGLGVTARGAFEAIALHLAELGIDWQRDPVSVVGVGDMSGDVFGNGMLLSRTLRLRAAFDHRHIFLDPDPDPEVSFVERERLFALPRSSWADYDATKLSAGGGIFPRSAKTIPLSDQVRTMLGLAGERATPDVVMRSILTLAVDLLYFGGIGTFVKAAAETAGEVGDRANDAVRVNGLELRARVLGEGANLGVTQAGRIEASLAGVRLDTDSLHNSAGVDTSDHEVNLKILVDGLVREGDLTGKQRDALLRDVTDHVVPHVLATNARQVLAVSLELAEGAASGPAHAALMARLESEGFLDRTVAGLPDRTTLAMRGRAGLVRPEVVVLLSHAKLWLTDALLDSALPSDPAFADDLLRYFPPVIAERFRAAALSHPLRRELLAMLLANDLLDRMGLAAFARLAEGVPPVTAARAALIARASLGLAETWAARVPAAPGAVDPYRHELSWRRMHEAAAAWFLRSGGQDQGGDGGISAAVARFAGPIAALRATWPGALGDALLDAALVTGESGAAPAAVVTAWMEAGRAFGLDALRQAAASVAAADPAAARALALLLADMGAMQRRLAAALLRREGGGRPDAGRADALKAEAGAAWSEAERCISALTTEMPGLAQILVAVHALRTVA
ncbi:NAD-glutamate dehydrogenase domain-containing protein [Elioraea sp.]|uniref:NAD-glutamate dehydrogenase n=1 Tax=Elioraea sp. TaxID=2185103 RepID=UPI0025C599E6|nr:NAD-glutamate dehydrogenase domain-containing protein [Elioraea sp.]